MTERPDATASDRAFALAAIALEAGDGDRLWSRLAPAWRDRVRPLLADALARGETSGPAREALAREHAAEARPDPARVHASWWVRALAEESPAVRLAVAARAEEPVRSWLVEGLGLDPAALEAARSAPVHPEALAIARALWAERLVGGPPPGDFDPPAIRALTAPESRDRSRLLVALALTKWAYVLAAAVTTPKADAAHSLSDRRRVRLESARESWIARGVEPKAAGLGRLDVEHHLDGKDDDLQKLGLVTVARLLADADPHRVRWALQHLPYPAAKFVRSRTGLKTPLIAGRELLAWERTIWEAAQGRGAAAD